METPKELDSVQKQVEKLSIWDVHAAANVLVAANDGDPVYNYCFPNTLLGWYGLQRRVFLYSLFGATMLGPNLLCTWGVKDSSGKLVAVCMFENENILAQLLGQIIMSLSLNLLPIIKLGLEKPLWVLILPIYVVALPFFLITFWCRFFFFGFNMVRALLNKAKYLREAGWHEKKKKYLIAIGASVRGQGYGTTLIKGCCEQLDKDGKYEGYHLESSNPRNVTFYERNEFEKLGADVIQGKTITFMVRPSGKGMPKV